MTWPTIWPSTQTWRSEFRLVKYLTDGEVGEFGAEGAGRLTAFSRLRVGAEFSDFGD